MNGIVERDDLAPGLSDIKGLIIDMDGVLWHGATPLPGYVEFFETLHRRDTKFVLATNNPSLTPQEFAQKATRMGSSVSPDQVITSANATVAYLKRKHHAGTRIHVIGEPSLKRVICDAGYVLGDDAVEAVVASMDRSMTYETLKRGSLLIRTGVEFIGTNADAFYPAEEGILPGSGAMLAALAASTGRQPIIMGKPQVFMFELALERMGLSPDEAASVGDRLDTDVEGATVAGLQTILVLSGVTTPQTLAVSRVRPTWVFSGIDELACALAGERRKRNRRPHGVR
jgi:4-nitrophenyl phosphatase